MRKLTPSAGALQARSAWRYRGQERPPFAVKPEAHQLSVWDFPRPPRIETIDADLRVACAGQMIARTSRGRRVSETASAPTYYFPPEDVISKSLKQTGRTFHCEWKGISQELSLPSAPQAGWVLDAVYPEFGELCGWYAFYPQHLSCFINQERAGAQPGGYYGGWVTSDLVGPIKGAAGSDGW
jgi:uncharacterized protein (DUF427 family)